MNGKLKTKKAVSKRIKITGTGKMMRRKMGVDHFRAKKSSIVQQRKSKEYSVGKTNSRILRSLTT